MTQERPNFRLILNKDQLITDKNHKALAATYREVVRPKKKNVNPFQQAQMPVGSDSSKKKKASGNQTVSKLAELGLTVFDPNDKTVDLDWDCLAGY